MMQSLNGGYAAGFLPPTSSRDAFFDDWATQMAIAEASRRLSRGSNGQRPGTALRIAKTCSANNSPRGSMASSKRRTTVNENHQHRRPQQDQQMRLAHEAGRPTRPVSWHPGTYGLPSSYINNQQAACYPQSTPNMNVDQDAESTYPQLSPMVASFSTNPSPCSSFSPLPLGYQGSAPAQYVSPCGWDLQQQSTSCYPHSDGNQLYSEAPPSLTHASSLGTPLDNAVDWNPHMMNGATTTTPPTPESVVYPQQAQPAVSEEPAPYEAMEDKEEEGEILVGMGLYDTAEKYDEDPQLNNYRSTVTSLLGSTFRRKEPTGKGLTLEQAWEPPKSEDGEDEAEDEDSTAATA
ncbi:hypothetical protein ACRE_017470 [Hapsidospora chrysogenum ATCC 11550]|uniref:Uncharacterized protein n=1 Tax=Hapsidospora chrysogenum (strain ATCC 11550 / CBS 779.69 / DSM 880 / IAM 14645 / JCM 23072 / IMI 49137) TaxID=857340 RepID=A0A086TDD6_HAPC1|nr:hypothetical protein ACRE_017470 [Hapsidospora chrysogenum ATCC 11550]